VIGGQGATPVPHVPFHYLEPAQLLTVTGCLAAGALLASWYLRLRAEPLPVRLLRAAHNGSANDYTAYAVAGVLIAVTVLAVG
jgi:multicomponent Na+:H+ antiporter subunit D